MAAVISSPFHLPDEDEEMSWQTVETSTDIDATSLHSADMEFIVAIGSGEMFIDAGGAAALSPSIPSHESWNSVGFRGQHQHQQQQQQQLQQQRWRPRSYPATSPMISQNMIDYRAASHSPAAALVPVSTASMVDGQGIFGLDSSDTPFEKLRQRLLEFDGLAPGLCTFSNETFPELGPCNSLMMLPGAVHGFIDQDTGLEEQPLPNNAPQPLRKPIGGESVPDSFSTQKLAPNYCHCFDSNPTSQSYLTSRLGRSRDDSINPSPQVLPTVHKLYPGRCNDEQDGVKLAIHEIPKKSPGIQKPKRKSKTPPRFKSPDHKLEDGVFKFCNQTVDTFGKPSFGDREHPDRPTSKGRKGALSHEVRTSALNVRKQGACFCCHVRKVKCDKQRPCKSCVKYCFSIPDAACWKFSEFTAILFPPFPRRHFERSQMSQFVEDNIASFTINGIETPCTVTLSSGSHFATKLTVKAKIFTPKAPTSEVMEHWHSIINGHGEVELDPVDSAPIGLDIPDTDTGGSLRAELKRKIMAYMDGLTKEQNYVVQLGDIIKNTTTVPMQVLKLVQNYVRQGPEADVAIVRRALGILVLQHVMSLHLTLTPQSLAELQRNCPFRLTGPDVTSRLLGRQIKQLVDECLKDLVPMLFDDFLKRLKSKSRKEWAPCIAAFLVFCLLMELIEATADNFAITEKQIGIHKRRAVTVNRAVALEANRQIENMPFKQIAYQFHQIYQTHSQDASAKGFNPLQDNARNDTWDLEPAAKEFVRGIREGIDGDFPLISRLWHGDLSLQMAEGELDWLTIDPILLSSAEGGNDPYPIDVSGLYMERLVARFLLSFKDRSYLYPTT